MKINDVPASILASLQLPAAQPEWPPLEVLRSDLLPVKHLSREMLPGPLADWCYDIAHRMQCPVDFVAVAAIAMIGSIIAPRCAVRPKQKDNWTEVPNLWGAIVARPGAKKTPATSAAFEPLYALDADANRTYEAARTMHAAEAHQQKMIIALQKKALAKHDASSPEFAEISCKIHAVSVTTDAPVRERYLTNDATVEMVGEILSTNARGLMVYRDELMGLISSFEKRGREGDRQFFLEGWNGRNQYQVDRIGRGQIMIPRLCVSVFGGIQPEKLASHISDMQSEGNDGFIQRFQLLVYPDQLSEYKIIDEIPDQFARDLVGKIVRDLSRCDFKQLGAFQEHEYSIPFFKFEAVHAQRTFFTWLEKNDTQVQTEDSPLVTEHLQKYKKLVPALALIFYLIDRVTIGTTSRVGKASTSGINKKCVDQAIAWAVYLESHARRIYASRGGIDVEAAMVLARKIESGNLEDRFSERDIYRKQWSQLTDVDVVAAACEELEAAGWIRRVPRVSGHRGRPTHRYEIRPMLLERKEPTDGLTKLTKRRPLRNK